MANPDDVARAKKGREVWNQWAEEVRSGKVTVDRIDFSGAAIQGIDFVGFEFPVRTIFRRCRFFEDVEFSLTKFHHLTDFAESIFHKSVDFISSEFERGANFSKVQFMENAEFVGATFKDESNFVATRFHGNADFLDASFEGRSNFAGCTVSGSSNFSSATFGDDAVFSASGFEGDVRFLQTTFAANLLFEDAEFRKSASLWGSEIKGPIISFDETIFLGVPDIATANFGSPPLIHNMTVKYQVANDANWRERLFKKARGSEDAANYRRLKKIAAESRNHEQEQFFFAEELRAKRFHQTRSLGTLALNIGYDWLSDFGRGVGRPALILLATILSVALGQILLANVQIGRVTAFAMLGTLLFTLGALIQPQFKLRYLTTLVAAATLLLAVGEAERLGSPTNEEIHAAFSSFVISTTNSLLLFGSDKWAFRMTALEVFGRRNFNFPLFGQLWAYVQSAFSLLLFFLIGLAFRNRFRMSGSSGG